MATWAISTPYHELRRKRAKDEMRGAAVSISSPQDFGRQWRDRFFRRCKVAPVANVKSTAFSFPRGVTVDASGKIYVTDFSNGSVFVFAANANGNSTPIQTIKGTKTKLSNELDGISLDYAGDMVISDYGSSALTVFTSGSTGNVPPKRQISGSNALIGQPLGNSL